MKQNYKIEGEGRCIVFIHGLSDNLIYWQPLVNKLKKHCQILRYDLRGHGLSGIDEKKITMNVYEKDLLNLLDKLDLKEVNLVGFSLGGNIALDFAIKHPNRVSSITLMSTFYKCDKHLSEVFRLLKQSLKRSFIEFYDMILPMVLCPNIIDKYEEELSLMKIEASKTANTNAYIQALDVCLNFDVEDKLGCINVPTLIFAGKYDEMISLSIQKQLHSKIEKSEMIILSNVKHNLLVGENVGKIGEILKGYVL